MKYVVGYIRNMLFLYIITFLVVIPLICHDLPYSKLFSIFNTRKKSFEKAKKLNNVRLSNAVDYFGNLDSKNSLQFYDHSKDGVLDLLVVIVTIKRKAKDVEKLGYFLQTASAFDHVLKTDKHYKKKKLMVCNVDSFPNNHTDAKYVSSFVPSIQRYSHDSSQTERRPRRQLYQQWMHKNRYEKETVDYMFCLESAYLQNSTYILMVEDDAIPYSDVLSVIKHTLEQNLNMHQNHFAYLKLYYPQKWQGYANETSRLIDLFSVGCIGAGIFVLIFYFLSTGKTSRLDGYMQYLYFVSGAIYFILLALLVGRQNVIELRRLSPYLFAVHKSPGCCTQAMLYTRHYVQPLLQYLEENIKTDQDHTDIAIYKYISSNNVSAYHVEPNLFHHIGMFSSLVDSDYKNPEEFLFTK